MADGSDARRRGLLGTIAALAVLVLAAVAALVVLLLPRDAETTARPALLSELQPGDCILQFTVYSVVPLDLTVVDCDLPHAAELVFAIDGAEKYPTFPGETASAGLATKGCEIALEQGLHLNPIIENYPTATTITVYRTRGEWASGLTSAPCWVFNADGSPLVGQLRSENVLPD